MKARKKEKNQKRYSKRTSWEQFEKYIDRLFDWAYVSNTNRYDTVKQQLKELPKHVITKENTRKGYASQIKQYCKWVYKTKGETNLRYYKKAWFEEYMNEVLESDNFQDVSVSSLYTKISALTKFENILEVKWKQEKNESIQFGIIANKRVREHLKQKKLYRNIEDMKKSRPIWDQETFVEIGELLPNKYKLLWNFLGITGMRLESALMLKMEDIITNDSCGKQLPYFHIEHGKAGKRSDVHLLNPILLDEKVKNIDSYLRLISLFINNFKESHNLHKNNRIIFDNFKKTIKQNGHKAQVNKRISTIKTEFEKVVREAGKKLNLENITVHSARKFYCNSVYNFLLHNLDEEEVNSFIENNAHKYESSFRNEIKRINSKRIAPRNFNNSDEEIKKFSSFMKILNLFTHEEKAVLVSSVESSHHRISIMSFYIKRTVSRKLQGKNTWYNN